MQLLTWQLPWGGTPVFRVSACVCIASICHSVQPYKHRLRHSRASGLRPLFVQIVQLVAAGGRPEVPPRRALPGPDSAGFAGLDAYCQLMRWVELLLPN